MALSGNCYNICANIFTFSSHSPVQFNNSGINISHTAQSHLCPGFYSTQIHCLMQILTFGSSPRHVFCSVWYCKASICKSISGQQYVFMVESSCWLNNYNDQSSFYNCGRFVGAVSPGFSDFKPFGYILCWVMAVQTYSLFFTLLIVSLKWVMHVFVINGRAKQERGAFVCLTFSQASWVGCWHTNNGFMLF